MISILLFHLIHQLRSWPLLQREPPHHVLLAYGMYKAEIQGGHLRGLDWRGPY
jgi:hypothetical protein